jgi:tRNA pseudouridine38-40 synthase
MPRYKLILEYDGTPFVGWQRQENGLSVQGALEGAFEGLTGRLITVKGAGRTDAGVHATAQVAHVDLDKVWRPDKLRDALNAHIRPHPVSVLQVEAAADDFDARFSAIGRRYLYRIIDRRAPPTLERDRVWHVPRRLDVAAMDAAAKLLVGHHDFTTFRSTECQAHSPAKTLETLDVVRKGDAVEVHTTARSFLHNQVRSMVGSLKHVGEGKWTAGDLKAALDARDRKACGVVAPPGGLYLAGVAYGAAARAEPASDDAD